MEGHERRHSGMGMGAARRMSEEGLSARGKIRCTPAGITLGRSFGAGKQPWTLLGPS